MVEVAVAAQKPADAREAVRKLIETNPSVPELFGSAAQIELSSNNPQGAIQFLRDGLKAFPGNPDMLFNLTQLELDANEIEMAKTRIEELKSRKFEDAPIRFLEARVLATQGEWRKAATMIEQSRALFDRSKDLLAQADSFLAFCYRNLGNPDQELDALRRVVSADPLSAPARESLANALLRSGRIQEAMSEFTQITRQANPPASAVLSLARLIFIDGLGRNLQGDQWAPLRQVLTILEKIPEAADDLAIMQAELLVVEEKLPEAEAILQKQIEKSSKQAALHQALISLQIRNEAWDEVEKSLARTAETLEDVVTVRLERGRYLIRRFGKQVDIAQLEQLAIPEESWTNAAKTQLAGGFAGFYLYLEDYDRARKYASIVADSELGKTNLAIHLLLFDLAFRSEDQWKRDLPSINSDQYLINLP